MATQKQKIDAGIRKFVRKTIRVIGKARKKMTPEEREIADRGAAETMNVSCETWLSQFKNRAGAGDKER